MKSGKFWRRLALGAVLLCAGVQAASAAAYLRVLSWNTLHAGYSGSTEWDTYAAQMWNDYGTTAAANNGVDLVFAQEVMYDTAAASLASALTAVSGVTWDYRVTAAIGRSSYKERYAVLFRTDRVQLLSSTVYTDTGDKFEREPQIVKVRHIQTGADYTFINWHTVFGTTAERQQEIADIAAVFSSVQSGSSSDQDVILLGDHNREATSPWWANLTGLSPVVGYKVNDLTSINTSCAFASAYDHFWYQASHVSEYSSSGRDYIADMCSFRDVSDHAPIFMQLYSSSDTD
jgi:endonuclease/exonuclease/phosphatase family metal-dependent hydrolase